jgi:hypothetical protein
MSNAAFDLTPGRALTAQKTGRAPVLRRVPLEGSSQEAATTAQHPTLPDPSEGDSASDPGAS